VADALGANITVFLSLLTFGLAFLLFVVGIVSWWRLRGVRLGAVALAFGFLSAKAAWVSWNVLMTREPDFVNAGFDAVILAAFYVAIAKR
jgi:hypothetical protein